MTRKNYAFAFAAVIAAAIVLNGFLTAFLMRSRDFVNVDNTVMSRTLYLEAERILLACDGSEYAEDIRRLEKMTEDLREYRSVYEQTGGGRYTTPAIWTRYTEEQVSSILAGYSYTDSEAAARIAMLQYCIERLQSALDYPDYVKKVIAEAELLSGINLYDDAAKRRILKAGTRFYGFENIRVSAEPELGVMLLFETSPGNWVAAVMAVVCAFLYYLRCHAGASEGVVFRGRVGVYALFFGIGNVLLFASGAYVSHTVFGLGNLRRAVQSLSGFYSCPYMMSVGMLLGLSIGAKVLACTALYLFLVGVLFCRRKYVGFLAAFAVLAADFLLARSGAGIRLGTVFHAERLGAEYVGVSLLGDTVNAGWMLAGLLVLCLAAALFFAVRQVAAALLQEKERQEKLYFEEINHKYTEARYIRHDINNHLTALALLMDEGRTEEARKYLDMVSAQLDEVRPPVKTGSPVLDAVLFGKVKAAEEKGAEILLDFAVDFTDSGISDYDLCSVFSNLLDNAIEACEKLPEQERRIKLRVKRQEEMICVFCENKYRELVREGRGFATSKSDKGAHGFGLKRIRGIAEKYNGSVEISTEAGVFSVAVLFVREQRGKL